MTVWRLVQYGIWKPKPPLMFHFEINEQDTRTKRQPFKHKTLSKTEMSEWKRDKQKKKKKTSEACFTLVKDFCGHLIFGLYSSERSSLTNFIRFVCYRIKNFSSLHITLQSFNGFLGTLSKMVRGNFWDQCPINGFWVRQPLVSRVFSGCPQLVVRWNVYIHLY